MDDLFNAAAPHLLEIAGLLLTAIIGWAANTARRKWGIDIEAKYQSDLHTALTTAARLALAKQMTGAAAIDLILDYAKRSVPDALNKLNPSQAVIENLAKSKIEAVKAEPAFQAGQAIGEAIKQAVR
ncbi:hypothetical protein ACFOM8_01845 [Paracoccus angustae]|uniref:Bacteriophage holin of superfamily 6 (Holin_LLH) n=1 Tax=Paracoccus angustae TaxID=1671480 RepID=A0ABV7TZH5_9RHOB